MYEIILTKVFKKKATKLVQANPSLFKKYHKTLNLLQSNPYHPSLRLHKLKGNKAGFHSVSINMQYCIVLDFIIKDDQIILIDIGSHDGVY